MAAHREKFLQVTLIVRVDQNNRNAAEREIVGKLDDWFTERLAPPFGQGALMRYQIEPTPFYVAIDPREESHTIVREKTL